MNNVLAAILGLASTYLESQPSGSPVHRAFETISKAAQRGGKLVKSLLTFARQSPEESLQLDLNTILREEIRLLECTALAKVHLEVDLAAELQPIRGDAGALTHALMNLCINAVDAMPADGTLTLRTRNIDHDWVEVVVADTGIGMSKEVLEKALDPFFTTKDVGKGTGLGLSTVYATVKAHHGHLEILSEPDQGTRVSLRFHTCEPMVPAEELANETQPEPFHGALTVLVVDDDELVQSSMQAILDLLGHTVITARSGEEALAKLAARLQPDLVILDMNMPGLGGSGTLPRLRAMLPAVPILLATGRADQASLDLIEANPKVTLLAKPFSVGELRHYLGSLERE
jgi:CheY-like chemotaxis protein